MNGIRILIALAAVALAAVVAAAPASPQSLSIGSPLLGDGGLGVNLPDLGGGGSGGSSGGSGGGGSGGGGGGGGGGDAVNAKVSVGDTTAKVRVACIRANVLDISARVGTCNRGRGGGGGDRGAADAKARSGSLGAGLGVGCIDIGLGSLGDGVKVGSCVNGRTGQPPGGGGGGGGDDDPADGGSGDLPANAGGGVAGAGAGGGGAGGSGPGGGGGNGAGLDSCPASQLSGTVPYGVPTWLAGLLGVATFLMGAFVARRRRPQAEDVAV